MDMIATTFDIAVFLSRDWRLRVPGYRVPNVRPWRASARAVRQLPPRDGRGPGDLHRQPTPVSHLASGISAPGALEPGPPAGSPPGMTVITRSPSVNTVRLFVGS